MNATMRVLIEGLRRQLGRIEVELQAHDEEPDGLALAEAVVGLAKVERTLARLQHRLAAAAPTAAASSGNGRGG